MRKRYAKCRSHSLSLGLARFAYQLRALPWLLVSASPPRAGSRHIAYHGISKISFARLRYRLSASRSFGYPEAVIRHFEKPLLFLNNFGDSFLNLKTMNIREIFYPTKSRLIGTVVLFLLGIIFQFILAIMLVSFDFSLFGNMAMITTPFMWIFFWPVAVLINLITQEWWILVIYFINFGYLYFISCMILLTYSSFKKHKKWTAKIGYIQGGAFQNSV